MNRFALVGVIAAFAGTACGGGGGAAQTQTQEQTSNGTGTEVVAEHVQEPPPPPPPQPARARVIHAAAGAATANVNGNAGDAQLGSVAFKGASAYTDVAVVADVTVAAEGGTSATGQGLTAGAPATFVVFSDATTPANLAVLALTDEGHTETGSQRARAVNALLGAASIDVCFAGGSPRDAGQPIFTNVEYGHVGGIESFPSRYQPMAMNFLGGAHIQVRAHSDNACSGRVLGSADVPEIDANQAHNMTMVVVGRASGRPAVAKELLFCQDAPADGTCTAVPLH